MNKSQLVEQVAERLEMSRKDAAEVVEAVIQAITESVARGERVAISGFGIFEQVFRAARIGRNPRTGETVKIRAVTMPKFRPGTEFKNIVAGARDLTHRVTGGSETAEKDSKPDAPAEPEVVVQAEAPPAQKATTAKKAPAAKKPAAKRSTAKKAPAAKRATAKKASTAKRTPTKKTAPAAKRAPTKRSTAKRATAKKTAAKPVSSNG